VTFRAAACTCPCSLPAERGETREGRDERREGSEERRGEEHIKMMAWGDEPERTTEEGFQTIVSRQKASVRWKELLSVFF
jgi:hypothetical protein